MEDLIERLGVWLREWQSDVDRNWRRAPSSEEAARLILAQIEDTGFRIVPKEATDKMIEAGWCDGRPGSMWETYRRMVNAAPSQIRPNER